MLKHIGLYDPVVRTKDMETTEFTKYTRIRSGQMWCTDPKIVNEISEQFYKEHATTDNQENLDRIWKFVEPKISKNIGLAAFIMDYDGAKSRFFFPWLYNVSHSPSLALEMSYGAGEDVDGNWIDKVPETDPIDFFVRNDPTFVYNRERQLYVADLVTTIQDYSYTCPEHLSKVVDFGAGRLAWARWHGFQFKPEVQKIYAFDKDESINMESIFETNLESLGLEFRHGDLMVQVNNPLCMGVDLAILGGVATYIRKDIFEEAVVMPIYHLMNPGGVFFFDLQINCPYLQRSMSIFDWPKMYLADTIEDAIKTAESIRKALWLKNCKTSAEYILDTYNESPTAIMVTLQKL